MEDFRPGRDVDDENPLPVRQVGELAAAIAATNPISYDQITSTELQQAQHLSPPAGAMRALVQNNGGSTVRWRDDGVNPTSGLGIRIYTETDHTFIGDLSLPTFIDEGQNAVLDIAYYG